MVKYKFREREIQQSMYPFRAWRRIIFVALAVIVIVIALAPAVTQGTAIVRLSAITALSTVTHLYVAVSSVQLHREGLSFISNSSWTSVSESFPTVDLLSGSSQALPQIVTSAAIHSGRYDAVRLMFTNCTLTVAGQNRAVSAPPSLKANVTLPISPNGIGDVLMVVEFDYATVFASSPSLSFTLVRVSTS